MLCDLYLLLQLYYWYEGKNTVRSLYFHLNNYSEELEGLCTCWGTRYN